MGCVDSSSNFFLYNDDVLFALSKPSNIHSVINNNIENDSIAATLLEQYPELECVNKKEDAGLLNRLDFETSGILYGTWKREYVDLFKSLQDDVIKLYFAVVEGKAKNIELETYIGSVYRGSKKVKVYSLDKNPKRALIGKSKIEIVCYNKEKNLSLVKVYVVQARRHQIRAHLGYLGCPLLGDDLYGAKMKVCDCFSENDFKLNNIEIFPKFLLHNEKLRIKNPVSNKIINIEYECKWKNLLS